MRKGIANWLLGILLISGIAFYGIYAKTFDAQEKDPIYLRDLPSPDSVLEMVIDAYKSDEARALHRRAVEKRLTGDLEEAEELFLRVVDLAPQNPNGYYALATFRDGRNEHESAKVYYLKALEMNPDFYPAYAALGTMMSKRNNSEESIDFFSKALAVEPNHTYSHYGVAVAYHWSGDSGEALKHYRKVIELLPGSNLAVLSRERIDLLEGPER